MSGLLENLISGLSHGYQVTLPNSLGGKVLEGVWNDENYVRSFDPHAVPGLVGGDCLNQADYLKLVEEAKTVMRSNQWQKIVTSRCFQWNFDHWNKLEYIQHLRSRFPESFLIVLNHPVWGIWVAASPELLLKKNGYQIETMALAGTLSAHSEAGWGEKEIAEHEVVRDMIIQTLELNHVDEITIHPRNELYFKTVKHLQTKITGLIRGEAGQLVLALSPTPALAGMPVQSVLRWLVANEKYNRGLYGGIVNVQDGDDSYAIVMLRCLHINEKGALGFVGGGIMPDSIAEIEWNETVMKQNAFIFARNESIR